MICYWYYDMHTLILIRTDSLFWCVSWYIHKNAMRHPARITPSLVPRSRACHKHCRPVRTVIGAEVAGLSWTLLAGNSRPCVNFAIFLPCCQLGRFRYTVSMVMTAGNHTLSRAALAREIRENENALAKITPAIDTQWLKCNYRCNIAIQFHTW